MISPKPANSFPTMDRSSPAVEVGTGRALRSLSSSILKAMGGKPTPASTRNATTPQET